MDIQCTVWQRTCPAAAAVDPPAIQLILSAARRNSYVTLAVKMDAWSTTERLLLAQVLFCFLCPPGGMPYTDCVLFAVLRLGHAPLYRELAAS